MRPTSILLLLLLLSGPASGQLVVTADAYQKVDGPTEVRVYEDKGIVLVKDDSNTKLIPVGLVQTNASQDAIVRVSVNPTRESVPTVTLSHGVYLIDIPGVYWVDVFDWSRKEWITRNVTVGVSPPEPEPEPDPEPEPGPSPPSPTIPDDEFNNLGQKVATWVKDVPTASQLGKIYREGAEALKTDQTRDLYQISSEVTDKASRVPGYQEGLFKTFFDNLNTDISTRWESWTNKKAVLARYFDAVANGLEGA